MRPRIEQRSGVAPARGDRRAAGNEGTQPPLARGTVSFAAGIDPPTGKLAAPMSPQFWSRVAALFFPVRWWLMTGSLTTFALLAWSATLFGTMSLRAWFACSGPLTFLPWTLFCACLWFHEERGTMREGVGWSRWFAPGVFLAMRWYAAVFLSVAALVAGIGIPAIALLG